MMGMLWQDLRFALRTLVKSPWVTILSTGSLALAIAGNTVVYSLVNGLIHRPLPYEGIERLVFVCERSGSLQPSQLSRTSAANYLDFRERQSSFQDMAAFRAASYTLNQADGQTSQANVGEVTPGFFPLLGTRLASGRPFLEEEGRRGRDQVAVLSHSFWTEHFEPGQDIREATLRFNGDVYTVVGVLDPDFEWFISPKTEVWVPLVLEAGSAPRLERELYAIARLKDGIRDEVAESEIESLMAQLKEEYPKVNRGYEAGILNMRYDLPDSQTRYFLTIMQVALLFVLLIACSNIANLLLARSQAREREIAIRSSLGANRTRIAVQLLTESLVMAVVAGIIGVGLGTAGMKVVNTALASSLPSMWLPTMDPRVLIYCLFVTLAGGILFGIAPVFQTFRTDLVGALKEGTRSATLGGKKRLASKILVVAEISLAIAFLAGASMMIQTFQVLQNTDPGFDTENLLLVQLDLPDRNYSTVEQKTDAATAVVDRLQALPGVRSVIISNLSPRTSVVPRTTFEIEGQPPSSDQSLPKTDWVLGNDGYFETLGITLKKGRLFEPSDRWDSPQVAVLNEAMVQRFWSEGADPLGDIVTILGERREVVGVVSDSHHGIIVQSKKAGPLAYLPWAQQPSTRMRIAVKTDVAPESLSEPVRRELVALDPNAALSRVQTLEDFVDEFWVGQRIFTAILNGFGALAMILAAFGTYGVLAYNVSQRTQEIGIRMAIGASRREVVKMISGQAMALSLTGIAIAIPLIFVLVKGIASVFAGFVPVHPLTVVGMALGLTVVILAASAVPSLRAATIDPIKALRGD